jgi:hypothetical protein
MYSELYPQAEQKTMAKRYFLIARKSLIFSESRCKSSAFDRIFSSVWATVLSIPGALFFLKNSSTAWASSSVLNLEKGAINLENK